MRGNKYPHSSGAAPPSYTPVGVSIPTRHPAIRPLSSSCATASGSLVSEVVVRVSPSSMPRDAFGNGSGADRPYRSSGTVASQYSGSRRYPVSDVFSCPSVLVTVLLP